MVGLICKELSQQVRPSVLIGTASEAPDPELFLV